MLQRFGLRNFKAFRQQSFDLAPITVFVGRNGTGKSSVLQALALLKQSSKAGKQVYSAVDRSPVLVDLGEFSDVVHKGDRSVALGLQLEAKLMSLGRIPWPAERWKVLGGIPIVLEYGNNLRGDEMPDETVRVQPAQGSSYLASNRTGVSAVQDDISNAVVTIKPSFRGFGAEYHPSGVRFVNWVVPRQPQDSSWNLQKN